MPPKSRDGRGGPHAAVPPGLSACLRCVSQAPEQRPEHTGAGGGLLSKAAGDTAGSQTQFTANTVVLSCPLPNSYWK